MFAEVSHTPAVFGEDKVQLSSVASPSTVIKVQVKIKREALMFYFWTVQVRMRQTQQGNEEQGENCHYESNRKV